MCCITFWVSSLRNKAVNSDFSGQTLLQDLCTKTLYRSWVSRWCACILSFIHCGVCILSCLSLHMFFCLTMFKPALPNHHHLVCSRRGELFVFLVTSTEAVQFCMQLQEDCWVEGNAWVTKYRSIDLLRCSHSHLTLSLEVVQPPSQIWLRFLI